MHQHLFPETLHILLVATTERVCVEVKRQILRDRGEKGGRECVGVGVREGVGEGGAGGRERLLRCFTKRAEQSAQPAEQVAQLCS